MSKLSSTFGNCLITNFDTRNRNREASSSDVILRMKNNSFKFSDDSNFYQIPIFNEISKLSNFDGKKGLSIDDLIAAKEFVKNNKFIKYDIKNVRVDAKAKVGTVEYTNGQIIRVNFNVEESKGNFEDFSLALAGRESRNDYTVENRFHFLGKYQMGEAALEDAGLYKRNPKSKKLNSWDGTWTQKAKDLGVNSKKDFLNNEEAQEIANKDYKLKQWAQIKNYGLDKYIGKSVRGCKITASSLLAGAHLKGVKGLKRFLEGDKSFKTTDGFGTEISSYINKFRAYDIKSLVGRNIEYFV